MQLNDRTYQIKFKKIQAGQKFCVREEELPNPYFTPGSGGKPTFMGCVEYLDLSEQTTVFAFSTELSIDKCVLK